MAMIMVIMLSTVLVLIPMTMMTAVIGQLPLARNDQDRTAALAAAQAGVDDYINRLDNNPDYWEYNATTNPPPTANGALTGYVPVSDLSSNQYHYSVDASQVETQGLVELTSYGKSRNVTRIIKVGLRQVGFLDNLSLSNYNLVDPVLDPVQGTNTTYDCVYDWYKPNPESHGTGPDLSKCGGLINYWVTGNTLTGPVRSNDDFYICGTPAFEGAVITGDPNASDVPYWHDPARCGNDAPTFSQPSTASQPIGGGGTITFPASNAALEEQVVVGQSGAGCLYSGPTAITLTGSTMTVVSPDTSTSATNPNCLGTGVALPPNGVIYVQNLPTGQSCNVTITWDGDSNCGDGDVFIQGQLSGQLTVSAENNIFITGDLTYDSFTGTTVLGLIANNFVLVNHPVDGNNNTVVGTETFYGSTKFSVPADYGTAACNGGSTNCTVTIDAAILTLLHSFGTSNFSVGGVLGNIDLDGSLAGNFMDIEGVFTGNAQLVDGYNSNYTYDSRLAHLSPPYFLDPADSYWHSVTFEECLVTGCSS